MGKQVKRIVTRRWFDPLGVLREPGDVVMVDEALLERGGDEDATDGKTPAARADAKVKAREAGRRTPTLATPAEVAKAFELDDTSTASASQVLKDSHRLPSQPAVPLRQAAEQVLDSADAKVEVEEGGKPRKGAATKADDTKVEEKSPLA